MTAVIRRTYLITCDGWSVYSNRPCSSWEEITPPAESQAAGSEYVLRTLRRGGWRYEPSRAGRPRHYCPDHKTSGTGVAPANKRREER